MKRFLKKIINNWKDYFLDRESMLLFVALAIFFPSPVFYIVLIGFAPTVYSLLLGFQIVFTGLEAGYLLAIFIICIHFLINCYLLKVMVFIVLKPLKLLVKNSLVRKAIISLFVVLLILFAFLFNIYRLADAGGGREMCNFITLYKSVFMI